MTEGITAGEATPFHLTGTTHGEHFLRWVDNQSGTHSVRWLNVNQVSTMSEATLHHMLWVSIVSEVHWQNINEGFTATSALCTSSYHSVCPKKVQFRAKVIVGYLKR